MNIVEQIKKILAKAEATDNDHEASAFFAKAEELIIKHAVEEWQLSPEQREQVETRIIPVGRNRPDHALRNIISKNNGVRLILIGSSQHAHIVGRRSDIEFCEALYASLLLHRERELAKADRPPYDHPRSFNHSFRLAYAVKVAERMEAWKAAANEASGPGTELMLFDRSKEIDNFIEINIGRTHNRSAPQLTSEAGYDRGVEAGQRADISGGERNLGGSRSAIGG